MKIDQNDTAKQNPPGKKKFKISI